jgi:hypothetical protein
VFLRSFSDEEVATTFGRIVAPVVGKLGVVVGLAHRRQQPVDLHEETGALDRASLSVVPDDVWRAWVTQTLHNAAAVIIERSEQTPGVTWEVKQAIAIVGRARLAILYDVARADKPRLKSVRRIPYSSAPWELVRARLALRRWLIDALAKAA